MRGIAPIFQGHQEVSKHAEYELSSYPSTRFPGPKLTGKVLVQNARELFLQKALLTLRLPEEGLSLDFYFTDEEGGIQVVKVVKMNADE